MTDQSQVSKHSNHSLAPLIEKSSQQTPSIKVDNVLVPLWKLGVFTAHCLVGFTGIAYFTYKVFINKQQKVYDKATKRFKTKNPLFKSILKTVGWTVGFFVMTGVLIRYLKPTELLFEQAMKGDEKHYRNLKVDPMYQDYYIFQTMQYFGLSERLMRKTEEEFVQIKRQMQESGELLQQQETSVDKELIKIALSNQSVISKVLSTMNEKGYRRKAEGQEKVL